MSRFAGDYQVARSTGLCAATGSPLEPGAACIATLCERPEDEGFDRFDYSIDAWESGTRPDHLFSYWRTTVPHPNEKKNPLVDDEVLMDLFERLGDDDRPQRIAFRFVLGLILMRKRLLRFLGRDSEQITVDDAQGDEAEPTKREIWLMKPKGDDPEAPPIRLVNPHLLDEDVLELTEQLSEILQGEL